MGVVYEAEDLKLQRHVAPKFLPEEVMRRRHDAEALSTRGTHRFTKLQQTLAWEAS